MKHLISAALMTLSLGVSAASAQTIQSLTHDVHMTATVDPACSFTAPPSNINGNLDVTGPSNSTFILPIDFVTATVTQLESDTLNFPNAFCNTASTIYLSRSGFKHENYNNLTDMPNQMAKEIHYGAKVTWGETTTLVSLTAGGLNNATSGSLGPRFGSLNLAISVPADNAPLVAGDYLDTLRLSVIPDAVPSN
ncbi:MAG: hypothetical protein HC850_15555 [Rhodomicrobium sp.]|nr:hypothetical protein [Rhodomicrobium sp.]